MNRYWETTALGDMSRDQWEALCDGCGKCCLLKLEDEDTGQIALTNISCRLFDDATCRCASYDLRQHLVAGCVVLTPQNIAKNAHWMPDTCAYRRLSEGRKIPPWHPLITGDPSTTPTVRGHTVPEYEVDEEDFEDFIVETLA
ncbi:MAG: YcgN family cysteine cluster protein [Pseudomonadota bacterium]